MCCWTLKMDGPGQMMLIRTRCLFCSIAIVLLDTKWKVARGEMNAIPFTVSLILFDTNLDWSDQGSSGLELLARYMELMQFRFSALHFSGTATKTEFLTLFCTNLLHWEVCQAKPCAAAGNSACFCPSENQRASRCSHCTLRSKNEGAPSYTDIHFLHHPGEGCLI
jgi:hypothetical protein